MNGDRIPLGHLYSTGLEPKPDQGVGVLDVVNAVQNRDQIIGERQGAEIGKLMADVKLGEIMPDLQQRALERINQFQNDAKKLYGSQRNQLKLSSDNLNKAAMLKQGLMADLSAMQQVTKDYHAETKNVADYVAKQLLDPTDVADLDNEFRAAVRTPGTSFMDMPLFSNLTARKLVPKVKAQKERDALKIRNDYENEIVSQYSGSHIISPQGATVAQVKDFLGTRYPIGSQFWNNYKASLITGGVVSPEDSDEVALQKAAVSLRPSIKPPAPKSNTNFNFNGYGVSERNQKPVEWTENPNGTKSWMFVGDGVNYTKGAMKGTLIGVTKGTDGRWYGELSVPELNSEGMNELKAQYGEQIVDKLKNGVVPIPLDASNYSDIMRKGLDLIDADKEGFHDLKKQRSRTIPGVTKPGVSAPTNVKPKLTF